MRVTHNFVSTSQALRRVFFPPIEPYLSHPTRAFLRNSAPRFHCHQHRSVTVNYVGRNKRTYGPKDAPTAQRRDEAIQSDDIRLVGEDGKLQAPQWLNDVLDSMDRKKYFLVQVSAPDDAEIPICKIIEKAIVFQEAREKAKPQKKPDQGKKELEINWAIDAHDLSHRLAKIKQFLSEGRKVEVILADKKRGKKQATVEEMEAVIKKIQDAAKEVHGAKMIKIETGNNGKMCTVFMEGATPDSPEAKAAKAKSEKTKEDTSWGYRPKTGRDKDKAADEKKLSSDPRKDAAGLG